MGNTFGRVVSLVPYRAKSPEQSTSATASPVTLPQFTDLLDDNLESSWNEKAVCKDKKAENIHNDELESSVDDVTVRWSEVAIINRLLDSLLNKDYESAIRLAQSLQNSDG